MKTVRTSLAPSLVLSFVCSLAFCLAACSCDLHPGTPGAASTAATPALRLSAGAVAADMPRAREIGEKILAGGGSAADAAVATVLALGVENPSSSGLGGGGFAVVWDAAEHRAYSLDFRESAPSGASPSHYKSNGKFDPEKSTLGCLAAGVPGEPAGLGSLHSRFGTLAWKDVVEPARSLAENGYPVSKYLAQSIREEASHIAGSPGLAKLYLHAGGTPVAAGETIRDAELASTLGVLAREGAGAFYRGEIAAAIEAACRDVEGSVRAEDLAAYSVVWRAPVRATWRGFDVVSAPPPSSGGAVLVEILNVLEPLSNFDRRGRESAISYHWLAEAMKHGFADRATSYGDPDFVKLPLARLTSKAYADRLRAGIDGTRTQPSWAYGQPGASLHDDRGTTHVSVVDPQGNAVAITTSVNDLFGSFVRAPRTGVLLNNTLDDFSIDLEPNAYGLVGSKKNRIAPGRRPVSSMTPTVVLWNGAVRLVVGGSGGPRITSATLQTILGVLAEGRTVEEAVAAPRIHHQYLPDALRVEPGIPLALGTALQGRGHVLQEAPYLAAIEAVEVRNGKAFAAIDDRKRNPPGP